MARKAKITNQQILEAAREVFLQKGFGGSTLEIAQLAGISEASIFKRFSTKEELFFAALGIPEKPPWFKELETLAGKGYLKENLTLVCLQILEFYSEIMPRLMMLRSRGNALPEPEFAGQEPRPIRDVKVLTAFLERETSLGRLGPCEPQIVAHILLGSLMNYVFSNQMSSSVNSPTDETLTDNCFQPSHGVATEKLPTGSSSKQISGVPPVAASASKDSSTIPSSFVESLVETLWQGIAPKQG